MKRCFILSLLLLAGMIIGNPARAQRTSVGQCFFGVSGLTSFTGAGASLEFGRYGVSSAFGGFASASDRSVRLPDYGERLHYTRWEFGPEYDIRVFATKTRSLCIYAGADAFIGWESLNTWAGLSDVAWKGVQSEGYSSTKFIYGFAPDLKAELYFLPRMGVTIGLRPSFTFGSQFKVFKCDLSIGVRYDLFL